METRSVSKHERFLLNNYAPPSCHLVRGAGAYVWDDQNKRYLDFTSGIGVNALGHCHPEWVARVQAQTAELVHCSNLYGIPSQAILAERIAQQAGPGKTLFCNSGAEANEALIKLARLHGQAVTGEEGKKYKVLCAENAFHGRTFGGMAATPQSKVQNGFAPMLEGFAFGQWNDADSFEKLIDESTAAIMLETVQGEGGIHIAQPSFLKRIQALCKQHNLLLLIDEVQCGTGRTGAFFAYEHMGIQPDAIGMAKGLGGGFPIGAIWVSDAYTDLFTPGSHGTTFGGNPLACAAALAVLDIIEKEGLLAQVTQQSKVWHEKLHQLASDHAHLIQEVRALGYMVGIAIKGDHLAILDTLRNHGLLAVPAGGKTIRLLPPLNASMSELEDSLHILETTLNDHKEKT